MTHDADALTPADRAYLLDGNHGRFATGYTPDDIDRVLAALTGARLVCAWEYRDTEDMGGNSEIIGQSADGTWHRLSDEVWAYLTGDSDHLPADATLLDPAPYERQDIDTLPVVRDHNVAFDDQLACRHCGRPNDDGEGWDGYCGPCADRVATHDTEGHTPPHPDCPACTTT